MSLPKWWVTIAQQHHSSSEEHEAPDSVVAEKNEIFGPCYFVSDDV
jgi:hypothetical protein